MLIFVVGGDFQIDNVTFDDCATTGAFVEANGSPLDSSVGVFGLTTKGGSGGEILQLNNVTSIVLGGLSVNGGKFTNALSIQRFSVARAFNWTFTSTSATDNLVAFNSFQTAPFLADVSLQSIVLDKVSLLDPESISLIYLDPGCNTSLSGLSLINVNGIFVPYSICSRGPLFLEKVIIEGGSHNTLIRSDSHLNFHSAIMSGASADVFVSFFGQAFCQNVSISLCTVNSVFSSASSGPELNIRQLYLQSVGLNSLVSVKPSVKPHIVLEDIVIDSVTVWFGQGLTPALIRIEKGQACSVEFLRVSASNCYGMSPPPFIC